MKQSRQKYTRKARKCGMQDRQPLCPKRHFLIVHVWLPKTFSCRGSRKNGGAIIIIKDLKPVGVYTMEREVGI